LRERGGGGIVDQIYGRRDCDKNLPEGEGRFSGIFLCLKGDACRRGMKTSITLRRDVSSWRVKEGDAVFSEDTEDKRFFVSMRGNDSFVTLSRKAA